MRHIFALPPPLWNTVITPRLFLPPDCGLLVVNLWMFISSRFYADFFTPYFDRFCLRFFTFLKSITPPTKRYFTPGRSFTLPPLTRTTECSCKVWPSPGIYAITRDRVVNSTFVTFLFAELGFLGLRMYTRRHTPFFWGAFFNAGDFEYTSFLARGWFINWYIVGICLGWDLNPYYYRNLNLACLPISPPGPWILSRGPASIVKWSFYARGIVDPAARNQIYVNLWDYLDYLWGQSRYPWRKNAKHTYFDSFLYVWRELCKFVPSEWRRLVRFE